MNLGISKILNMFNFLAANGAGRADGSSSGSGGSWFVELVSWLADAVVNIATVVWGWLITIFYVVVRFCLNIIDILQMFVERLVGIQAYNQKGGLSALESIQDSDLIIRFITNETILKTFRTLLIIGLILLIVFSIIAIIKQNYAAASGDADAGKKGPNEVLKKAGRAIFLCLLVPFLVVFGLLGSNAVLASVCNAIRGDNDLTIGGLVFTASTYEANKFREYAGDGIKVPAVYGGATKVIRPIDYSTQEDMQLLFYELATGVVYIEYISDDPWFVEKQQEYDEHGWKKYLTSDDAQISATEITGSTYFDAFRNDFDEFNDHYFPKGIIITGNATLNELSMWDDIMKSVYKSNWLINKQHKDVTFTFDSTYTTQKEVPIDGTDPTNPTTTTTSIVVNSDIYSNYENFATIELEYFVMADLIDYAIEHNKTFYYVNANHSDIRWSEIPDPFDKDNEEGINIDEYRKDFVITSETIGSNTEYFAKKDKPDNMSGKDFASSIGQDYVSDEIFYVKYYNGFSRLYFSKDGATSENDGATYIICTKSNNGDYIPVTQTTTTFRSSYLDKDYGGAIVARGVFEPESIIPKSYVKPTIIQEQVVDEDGNELSLTKSSLSPFAIDDTYTAEENIFDTTRNFIGKLGQYTLLSSTLLGSVIDGALGVASNLTEAYKEHIEEDFASQIGIYNSSNVLYPDDEQKEKANNLLINKNIAGYAYKNSDKTKIELFDREGRNITSGAMYTNASYDDLVTEFDCEVVTPTGYVVIQQDVVTGVVIPWFVADSSNLSAVITAITASSASSTFSHNLIVAEYTYDQITIKLEKTSLNTDKDDTGEFILLGGMNITGIGQLSDASGSDINYVTSGEFIVNEQVVNSGLTPLFVESKKNLIVIDGEIYEADGDLFYGRETAQKYFQEIAGTFYQEKYLTSLGSYITRNISNANLNINYKDVWKPIFGSLDGDGDGLKVNFSGALMALGFKAGLAANMAEYTPKYYSIEETKIEEQTDGGETKVRYEGTITYYDKHNRELYTKEFSERTEMYGTATLNIQAVMSTIYTDTMASTFITDREKQSETMNINEDSKIYKALKANESLFNVIKDKFINSDDDWAKERTTYGYDVTYNYQYTSFKIKGENTPLALGAKISSVTMKPDSDNTEVTGNHLSLKNGNVVGRNGTELSMSAAKGYISSGNTDHTKGVAISYAPNTSHTDSDASSFVKDGNLTANIWNIKSSSEYDDFYIYFLRGDFSWSLLFDFCLNLPKLSLVPLAITFTFRCQLGTTYDYTEDVVYRLQAGQFYLDYNFREATGIGITNLFRMSSINPFILIFSTVLVLKIIWSCVWGLILRIYNMLLLFIMLPAVCSTMPMDDGARFSKWKDEIISQMFSAYAVLIMLNLYFVIVPIVKEVTSDLITATDLPSTITGMFSSIGMGLTSGIGKIKTFASGLVSSGASMLGSIGLKGASVFTLASELTNAELNLLGYVNRIIYIMFFLVLTTMLANGKELIKTVLKLGDLQDPQKDVSANWKEVKDFGKKAWNVAKKPVEIGQKLAGKVASGVAAHKFDRPHKGGRAEGLVGGSGKTGSTPPPGPTPSPTTTPPPGITPSLTPTSAGALPPGKGPQKHDVTVKTELDVNEPAGLLTAGSDDAVEVQQEGVSGVIGTRIDTDFVSGTSSKKSYVSPQAEMFDFGHIPTDAIYHEIHPDYKNKTIQDVQTDIDSVRDIISEESASISSQRPFDGALTLNEYNAKIEELTKAHGKAFQVERELNMQKLEMQQEGKFSGENKQNWDKKHNEALQELEKIDKQLGDLKSQAKTYERMQSDHEDKIKEYEEYASKLEHYKTIREANEKADKERDKFLKELEEQQQESSLVESSSHSLDVPPSPAGLVEKIVDKTDDEPSEDDKKQNKELEELTKRVKDLEESRTTADDAAAIAVAAATEASMEAVKNANIDNAEHARVADSLSDDGEEISKKVKKDTIKKNSSEEPKPTPTPDPTPVTETAKTSNKNSRLKKILKAAAIAMVVPIPVAAAMGGVMVAKAINNHKPQIKQGLSNFAKKRAGASNSSQTGVVPYENTTKQVENTTTQEQKVPIDINKVFNDKQNTNTTNQQTNTKANGTSTTRTPHINKEYAKRALRNAAIAMVVPIPVAAAMGGVMVAKTINNHKAEIKQGLSNFAKKRAGASNISQSGVVPYENTTKQVERTTTQEQKVPIDMNKVFNEQPKNETKKTTQNPKPGTTASTAQTQNTTTQNTIKQGVQKVKDGIKKVTSNIPKAAAIGAVAMVAPIPAVIAVAGGVMTVKGAKVIKKGLTKSGVIKSKHKPVDQVNNSASGKMAESKRNSKPEATTNNISNDEIEKKIAQEVKKQVEKEVKTEVSKQVKNQSSTTKTVKEAKTAQKTKELDQELKTKIIRSATKAASDERNRIVNEHDYRSRNNISATATAKVTSKPTTLKAKTETVKESEPRVTTATPTPKTTVVHTQPKIKYDFKMAEPQQNEEIFKEINLKAASKNVAEKEAAKNARKEISKTHLKVKQGAMSEADGLKAIEEIMKKLK